MNPYAEIFLSITRLVEKLLVAIKKIQRQSRQTALENHPGQYMHDLFGGMSDNSQSTSTKTNTKKSI